MAASLKESLLQSEEQNQSIRDQHIPGLGLAARKRQEPSQDLAILPGSDLAIWRM
jgi:hypothetical protein